LAAGLFDLIQGRRTHEIRLPGGCVFLMDKLARNALSITGPRKVGSVASDRHPRAIPARHRRTGDDRGCQRRPRNMAQPGALPKLADQRLFQNSAPKRLAVRRFVGSSPIASTTHGDAESFLRPCSRRVLFLPSGSVRRGETKNCTTAYRHRRRGSGLRHGCPR
jgi:hypothetical protein